MLCLGPPQIRPRIHRMACRAVTPLADHGFRSVCISITTVENGYCEYPTGLFRVRGKIQHPNISVIDGPILKPLEVVIDHSLRFCLVYLDGLDVGNYPSKICMTFRMILEH